MAGGLGLVGRQDMSSQRSKMNGAGRTVAPTDMASKSMEHMQSALDVNKKVQKMQKVTQAGG